MISADLKDRRHHRIRMRAELADRLHWRRRAAKARLYCERKALAIFGRRRTKPTGRLLCYHSVGQPDLGVNDCSPSRFRRQIELALRQGYQFVPAARIARGEAGPRDLSITFDDGWRSTLMVAAPILSEYQIPWTLFVATDFVDCPSDWHRTRMLTWDELGELSRMGVEIGSHSVSHPDFGRIDEKTAVDELQQSRSRLQSRLSLPIDSLAIPFGQSRNWSSFAHHAAQRAGYELIYAQAENTRPPGTIPRTFVTSIDDDRIFAALLDGAFDNWEEWY
ncbi:polysaccharide deacetylase family protein [Bradyrhizobium sp. STM 3809]|uniref:polysaccharide deacetylase family protein n=1 Tax=Bradyrhizobium sp. STM 3809 TaxID=551936 RepID=UPI001F0B5306|nr:polysaccharide deacetylase family protein [Bradyrhizobium sp. STM 3809]